MQLTGAGQYPPVHLPSSPRPP